jgi:hypothetical protein
VSIPPPRAGIFKASIRPAGYPSAWLRPRRARLRFTWQDHCSSTTSMHLNFRLDRHPLESAEALDLPLKFMSGCGSEPKHLGLTEACANTAITG